MEQKVSDSKAGTQRRTGGVLALIMANRDLAEAEAAAARKQAKKTIPDKGLSTPTPRHADDAWYKY